MVASHPNCDRLSAPQDVAARNTNVSKEPENPSARICSELAGTYAPSCSRRGASRPASGGAQARNLLAGLTPHKATLCRWAPVLAAIGLFLFLYRALDIGHPWAFGDLSPWFSDPGVYFRRALHLWTDEGIGYPGSAVAWNVTLGTLTSILGGCAQRLYFLALLPAALVAFRFVALRLGISRWAALGAGLVYALNPVSISEFTNGSAGVLAVYAAAPLVVYYIVRMVTAERVWLRDFAAVGVVAFILSFNAHTAFWLVALFTISALGVWRPPVRRILTRFSLLLVTAAPALAVGGVYYSHYYGVVSSPGWSALGTFRWCYGDVTLLRLLRLAGNKGAAQAALGYDSAKWFSFLGFVLPIVSALSMPWGGRRREQPSFSLVPFCLLTLAMSLGLILFVQHSLSTAATSPLLLSVRNPSKLMFVSALSLSFLFGFGLDRLRWICRRKGTWIGVFTLVLVAQLLYLWPALDGTLGIRAFYHGRIYYTPPYYYSDLPEDVVNPSATPSYVLLPWEYPGVLRMRALAPGFFGITIGKIASTGDMPLVYEGLALGARGIGDVLSQLGVRYVLVDKEYRTYKEVPEVPFSAYETDGATFLAGDSSYFSRLLENSEDLVLTENGPHFAVFRVRPATGSGGTVSEAKFVRLLGSEKELGPSLLREKAPSGTVVPWSGWPVDLVAFDTEWIALHTAPMYYTNVRQDVAIEDCRLYRFSFRVRLDALSGAHAKVVWFSSSRPQEGSGIEGILRTDIVTLGRHGVQEGTWSDVSVDLTAPNGAASATVSLLGNRGGSEGPASALVLYAQVAFCPVTSATLLAEQNPSFGSVQRVNFTKISATEYQADVSSTGPYVLAFAQTYDAGWVATSSDGDRYASQPLMGCLNSFHVDAQGPQHLTIAYYPQRGYAVLAAIIVASTVLWACCTVFTPIRSLIRRSRDVITRRRNENGA